MNPIAIGVIVLIVFMVLSMAVKIVSEYERGGIFRLGRLVGARGPGLFLIIPFIDRMVKVDLRVVTMDIPPEEAVTRDNVNIRIGAIVYFRVVDAVTATIKVLDHISETSKLSLDAFRKILIQSERSELVHLDEVSKTLQGTIDKQTRSFGVEVTGVELKEMNFGEKYKCNVCGNEASVMKVGGGTIVCCGQEMVKIGHGFVSS